MAIAIIGDICTEHLNGLFFFTLGVVTVEKLPMRTVPLIKGYLKFFRRRNNSKAKCCIVRFIIGCVCVPVAPDIVYLQVEICSYRVSSRGMREEAVNTFSIYFSFTHPYHPTTQRT